MKYCIGIDIGGTTVKMALFTSAGDMIDKWEIVTKTENEGITILSDVAESVNGKLETHQIEKNDVCGCGIGVPAPVSDAGIVNGSANLGWKYKEVKREAEELLGVPTSVGNDANVAALGEMWKGGGMGYQNLVMVTLGTGVGGGLIYKGKIINGSNGAGGEIGHICVNYNEEDSCGCGNHGCLEQYSSATGIVRVAKKRLASTEEYSTLRESRISAKSVFDAYKAGDKVASDIVDEVTQYLGHALANIAVIVDPEVVVIGGGVSRAGEVITENVEKHYKEKMFFANDKVKFVLATLGNDAGVYGAAKLVIG
ncbi:MAG: ROK family glucokinase [Eubacteriales bacterium]